MSMPGHVHHRVGAAAALVGALVRLAAAVEVLPRPGAQGPPEAELGKA